MHHHAQALSSNACLHQESPKGWPELPRVADALRTEPMCTPRGSVEVDQATIARRGTVPRLTVPSPPRWQPRPMMLAVQRRLEFGAQQENADGLQEGPDAHGGLYAAMRRYMGLVEQGSPKTRKRRRTKSGEGTRRPLASVDPNVVGVSQVFRARRGSNV